MIAKRRGSPYEHRRSKHWLKMKCEASQEFVVGGFTDPQGARVGLGALLVGYYEGSDFVFAGKIGTGFDTKLLLDLRRRLDAIELPTSPFTKATGLPRLRAHWVRPEIVVQVAFIEWTVHAQAAASAAARCPQSAIDVCRSKPTAHFQDVSALLVDVLNLQARTAKREQGESVDALGRQLGQPARFHPDDRRLVRLPSAIGWHGTAATHARYSDTSRRDGRRIQSGNGRGPRTTRTAVRPRSTVRAILPA